MGMVIAVREDSDIGAFFGFLVDHHLLACSKCARGAEYRLRYTEDQQGSLEEHRLAAYRSIQFEHPGHSNTIRLL